ncbi:MAG TPA: endolytic transglycosylase MltG [Polyangiaceae bacterium]
MAWVAASIVVLGAIYLALVFGYGGTRGPGNGREVELEWPSKVSPEDAGERLSAAGLVSHPRLFAMYLRATGASEGLRSGHHFLTDDLSPRELVRRMQRGRAEERVKLRIPEGLTRFDIAKRLQMQKVCSARAFLDASVDVDLLGRLQITGDSAEGFLFPATYDFAMDSEPSQVVTRMKGEFDKRFEKLTRDNAQGTDVLHGQMGWGTQEIVTMASIVEKEAAVDEERPLIASVFLNRLRDPAFVPKRLQSDPTSAYGCMAHPERISSCRWYTGKVTPDMNSDDSNPYTTYRHEGLPPGPISNPGEKSLAAVLVPSESHYLYFVARGEGRHTFSETYAQHTDAIRHQRALSQSQAPSP